MKSCTLTPGWRSVSCSARAKKKWVCSSVGRASGYRWFPKNNAFSPPDADKICPPPGLRPAPGRGRGPARGGHCLDEAARLPTDHVPTEVPDTAEQQPHRERHLWGHGDAAPVGLGERHHQHQRSGLLQNCSLDPEVLGRVVLYDYPASPTWTASSSNPLAPACKLWREANPYHDCSRSQTVGGAGQRLCHFTGSEPCLLKRENQH